MELVEKYIYVIFFLYAIFIGILGFFASRTNLFFFKLSLLFAILLSGLSYGIGVDYFSYKKYFELYPNLWGYLSGRSFRHFGLLFDGLQIVSKTIINDFSFFIILCTTINILLISKAIRKYSPYPLLSLFLYLSIWYYIDNFASVLRQGLASAFFLLSIESIINRNFKKYMIYFLVAFMFHKVAIIMLPVYWFTNIKFNRRAYIIIFALSFIFSFIPLNIISNKIFILFGKEFYIESDLYTKSAGLTLGMLKRLFFLMVGWYYLFYTRLKENKLYGMMFNIYFLSTIVYFGLNSVRVMATRGSEFLEITEILMIPFWFVIVKKTWRSILPLYLSIVIIFSYLFVKKIYFSEGSHMYVPYRSILFK